MPSVILDITGARATITLNRPDVHNAFDDTLIAELDAALAEVSAAPALRVAVVAAAGCSFSAGADLSWMKRTADYAEAENRADAERLAEVLHRLDALPVPTVARVQGTAMGGGVGLVAACDIAVAAEGARFALSEVRLGLIPAGISPYVIGAIGARAARRYFLTGERFDAAEAYRLGLVHAVVAADALDARVDGIVDALGLGAPGAVKAAKALVREVAGGVDAAVRKDTAARIARLRASAEGREGVAAFLEKRKPSWIAR